jgi:hypothetical protein
VLGVGCASDSLEVRCRRGVERVLVPQPRQYIHEKQPEEHGAVRSAATSPPTRTAGFPLRTLARASEIKIRTAAVGGCEEEAGRSDSTRSGCSCKTLVGDGRSPSCAGPNNTRVKFPYTRR